MNWETRGEGQKWGLQISCCSGQCTTLPPSWCTPKCKSPGALMVGHTDSGARARGFKCWLLRSYMHDVGHVAPSLCATILSSLEGWRWWYFWCDAEDAVPKTQLTRVEGVSVVSGVQRAYIRSSLFWRRGWDEHLLQGSCVLTSSCLRGPHVHLWTSSPCRLSLLCHHSFPFCPKLTLSRPVFPCPCLFWSCPPS